MSEDHSHQTLLIHDMSKLIVLMLCFLWSTQVKCINNLLIVIMQCAKSHDLNDKMAAKCYVHKHLSLHTMFRIRRTSNSTYVQKMMQYEHAMMQYIHMQ